MFWSSEQVNSVAQFYSDQDLLSHSEIPVQGMSTSGAVRLNEGFAYAISNGPLKQRESHLTQIDLGNCQSTTTKIPSTGVLEFGVSSDAAFGIDSVNFQAGLWTHSLADGEQETLKFDAENANTVGITSKYVALISRRISGFQELPDSHLRVFSRPGLELVWERDIPVATTGEVAARGETIYVGELFTHDDVDTSSRILEINLENQTVNEFDSGTPLPMLLRTQNNSLYIGHSFINPAVKDMWDYREFTITNLATGESSQHVLDEGIIQFEVLGDALYVLGEASPDEYQISTYRLPEVTRVSSLALQRPTGRGYVYMSGFFPMPAEE